MQFTRHTDYALRALIYLGQHPHDQVTVRVVSDYFDISYNHLVKVVHQLSSNGLVTGSKGRGGGIQLAKPPQDIRLGEVVRTTESIELVECQRPHQHPVCPIEGWCALQGILEQASDGFLGMLDAHTLADLLAPAGSIHANTPLRNSSSPR